MALFGINTIKAVNKAKGMHFFDKDAMRFFNSRVQGDVFSTPHGAVFVTSERFDDNSARMYTTRHINEDTGHVSTLGSFQEFKSRSGALTAAKRRALNISAFDVE